MDDKKREELISKGAVGCVDRLGYLRCIHCANSLGQLVYRDAGPHNNERCDACGVNLKEVTSKNH